MRLKRVRIFGFKTFADRTDMEFDADTIAVVGPNGCGKSNIVDALLWGLGEHNSRNLRAQTGQEVIFAGSSERKPLGFAEVALLFDNEDGAMPIDSPEVLITRRITRAGDSEYSINKRACRLKDVVDLLADTGLGRTGYAIVGQQDIDQALAASAQQRRAWIDEAAGVQRYRARRTDALRRLSSLDESLVRLQDILREVENQRAPLEQEAEVARRYRAAIMVLRELETGLLTRELFDAVHDIEAIEEREAGARSLMEKELARVDELENSAREARAKLAEIATRADGLQTRLGAQQTMLERAKAAVSLAEARLESVSALQENFAGESEHARERLAQARTDVEAAQAELEAESRAFTTLEDEVQNVDRESVTLAQDLARLERELEQAISAEAAVQRQEIEAQHRAERASALVEAIEGIDEGLPDLRSGIAEALAAVEEQQARDLAAQTQLRDLEALRQDHARSVQQHEQDRRKLLGELASLDGKRRGLQATLDSFEGLAHGSRAVLALVARGDLEGSYIPVARAVEVDAELAKAIDTALGASANDLIVPDEDHAKRAIALLKAGSLGRATFQPIPLMRPNPVGAELRELLRRPGVLGLAGELVRKQKAHAPVIESLLGRVLVTRDLETALSLARTRGWSRIVTLDGEVVHASGGVTGGQTATQGSGMVARQAEVARTEEQILALQSELAKSDETYASREERSAQLQAQIDEMRSSREQILSDLAEAKSWHASLRHELESTERERQRLEKELEVLRAPQASATLVADVGALRRERDAVLAKASARSAEAASSVARLREAEERRKIATARLEEARVRFERLDVAEKTRDERAKSFGSEKEAAHDAINEAEAVVVRTAASLEEIEQALASAHAERERLGARVRELEEQARAGRDSGSVSAEQIHRCELERARADARRASVLERLLEEYGIDQEAALEIAPKTEPPPDAHAVVQRTRREIKAMGEVNLGAIDAYDRLTERARELGDQLQDLEGGKAEVERGIRELDHLTRDRFTKTFAALQIAFSKMFQKMFGGGEGKLELADPGDLLETGVEIEVTVPGKRCQRLELLSGGERAMSGLAFLFALLEVKPTPLAILDEVDAPLDGRNVERFLAMLKEFVGTTQFVLITHNPVTIEAADLWYGVTMREPGVSTLVPFTAPPRSLPKPEAAVTVRDRS